MKEIESEITAVLTGQDVSFIRFVDVSGLPVEQNRGLSAAVFFGIALTPAYLEEVMETKEYVRTIIAQNRVDRDEFHLKELKAGELSDRIADLLVSCGYRAYSFSDASLIATGAWDAENLRSVLPQKTVGVLSGAGWIGKNNLLITPEYGPALCVGTVLTDAPLHTPGPQLQENRCGSCKKCVEICPTHALLGRAWQKHLPREDILQVHRCTTCLQCLTHCVHTQKYLKQQITMKKVKILVFRTSVANRQDMERIGSMFAQDARILKWNVDFEDWEKVLRIECMGISADHIINALQEIRVEAAVLE